MQASAVLTLDPRQTSGAVASLARRVEAAEAANVLLCAQARCEWMGFDSDHDHARIGGGVTVYAGRWTHLNHALAFRDGLTDTDVLRVTRFFEKRSTEPVVRVSSLQRGVIQSFLRNGYTQTGEAQVVVRQISAEELPDPGEVEIRTGSLQPDLPWLRASTQGFCDREDVTDNDLQIGATLALIPGAVRFAVTSAEGEVCSTAALTLQDGVALLFGDSTRLAWRGLGLQRSAILSRLAYASASGCDLAVSEVDEGSGSARNYLRCGFTPAYTRVTLQRF
ncbi:MAG TPA: hypothetical protein VES20_04490 [Bryobacteraceae bacterium]|nr:hypothetical protein [Bryobacteraceae bacterium]